MSKHPLETLSGTAGARKMLTVWGLRVSGRSFSDGLERECEGERRVTVDDELALVTYVEETPGFGQARPVLAHVFVEGKPLVDYPYRQWVPTGRFVGWKHLDGETACALMPVVDVALESLLRAAGRHGQAELVALASMHGGVDEGWLAGRLLSGFVGDLALRLQEEPFRVPRAMRTEMDAAEVASIASAVADRHHPDEWGCRRV